MTDKTTAYLRARFGELPDRIALCAEDLDDDNLSPEQMERQLEAMDAMTSAMEPFAASLPDIAAGEFATLGMAGVTAQQFAIICEARRAAWLTAPQWKAVSEVFAGHKLASAKAATV